MKNTNVLQLQRDDVLEQISVQIEQWTPQVQKAAAYVLENADELGLITVRDAASAAGVSTSTLTRLAQLLGYASYDELRAPFREYLKLGKDAFPDRARWLQSIAQDNAHGGLYADMASASISNIESTFNKGRADQLKAAADLIVAANKTFVLGVGVNHSLATNFAYLADMALGNVEAIPRLGSMALDEVGRLGKGDVLLAMTFKPYRREVVEAVVEAKRSGVTVIAISDSRASPILRQADQGFVVASDSPQFFPSTVATLALLETLVAFVVADAGDEVVANIQAFHERRHKLGIYLEEWDS